MEKMARERAVRERRERKAEKKRVRKLATSGEAASEPGAAGADGERVPPDAGEDGALFRNA